MEKPKDGAVYLAMHTVAQSRLVMRRYARPILLVFTVFYLGFHTFHGERGLYALVREQQELKNLQAELTETRDKRIAMETRVTHMRDGSIDLDLLDEQMRRMLGVSKPGEIVVLQPKKS